MSLTPTGIIPTTDTTTDITTNLPIAQLYEIATGNPLWEEPFVLLNLCLRKELGALAPWVPTFAQRRKINSFSLWVISLPSIDQPLLPIFVIHWLQSQVQYRGQGDYLVHFTKDVDCPFLVGPADERPPRLGSPKSSSFLKTKAWVAFVKQQQDPNYKVSKDLSPLLPKEAKWFFAPGFYRAPSMINGAGDGLFSLTTILPGTYLFVIKGKYWDPDVWATLPERQVLERFAFEASWEKEQWIIDPTWGKGHLLSKVAMSHPGAWMNEPPAGMVSHVLTVPIYDSTRNEVQKRCLLWVVAAREILPHQEIYFHYGSYYHRPDYQPGIACPDVVLSAP